MEIAVWEEELYETNRRLSRLRLLCALKGILLERVLTEGGRELTTEERAGLSELWEEVAKE